MLKLPCVQAERSCSATIGLRQSAYTHGVGFFFFFLFNTLHMDNYWYNEHLFTGKCLHLTSYHGVLQRTSSKSVTME